VCVCVYVCVSVCVWHHQKSRFSKILKLHLNHPKSILNYLNNSLMNPKHFLGDPRSILEIFKIFHFWPTSGAPALRRSWGAKPSPPQTRTTHEQTTIKYKLQITKLTRYSATRKHTSVKMQKFERSLNHQKSITNSANNPVVTPKHFLDDPRSILEIFQNFNCLPIFLQKVDGGQADISIADHKSSVGW